MKKFVAAGVIAAMLFLGGCGSGLSVAVGLLDAASAAITVLANGGVFPPADKPWVLAASQFVTDAATELGGTDPTATKIDTILADFTKDFAGVPIPPTTNAYIAAAILAIEAFEAYIKSQQSTMATAHLNGLIVQLAGTPTSADKKALTKIVAAQKAFVAKIR